MRERREEEEDAGEGEDEKEADNAKHRPGAGPNGFPEKGEAGADPEATEAAQRRASAGWCLWRNLRGGSVRGGWWGAAV
jgi:hypothetical protein